MPAEGAPWIDGQGTIGTAAPFFCAVTLRGIMINAFKAGLLVAVAGSALAWASDICAQAPVAPPAGGFYMADGSRTADYQAALASWREDAQFSVDYSKAYMGLDHAYTLGLTVNRMTIGVNDASVYMDHRLFGETGKIQGLNTVVSGD